MDGTKHIVYNAIRTPDGTVLHSKDRHDYITYLDKNGREYMVDGGTDYLRRTIHEHHPYVELSVKSNDPHETIRQVFFWGTFGREPDYTQCKWVKLMYLSNGHINAIIINCNHLSQWRKDIFKEELVWRKRHNIFIAEVESYE